MPPRRKPTSTRQKKADQKLRRAIKRGDPPLPEPKSVSRPGPSRLRGEAAKTRSIQIESVRRLQSAFMKMPPEFLEKTKIIASTVPVARPIANANVLSSVGQVSQDLPPLTCPRRPKWRFDMSKKEVEHNEEGLFKKWLEQMDKNFRAWQESTQSESPSYFERNVEVWRQLWRVTEVSQIILVLLDSRCPLLHYPPSLHEYLANRKVIFVLTKVDITGPACAKAWSDFLRARYPGTRIVQVESYIQKSGNAAQGRSRFEPHIPTEFRDELVKAIKATHTALLESPANVRSNPSRLQAWKAPVRRDINWELLTHETAIKASISRQLPSMKEDEQEDAKDLNEVDVLEYLTIGLIGQPNVGKSSLLNALFGQPKVKASKTPGKTKHFQTMFWTPEIRLVDCPGLVMPNYLPMELQVLCGILPISRISAVPACIHFAANLLPLERIFALIHPNAASDPTQDKRTWREGMTPPSGTTKVQTWTAMDMLIAHANAKGWVTAKAARPDVHRAGNHILRLLAEGGIGWSFWPPGTDEDIVAKENGDRNGIWIPRLSVLDEEDDEEDDEEQDKPLEERGSEHTESEEESSEEGAFQPMGRFNALSIDNEESEDEESN